MAPRLSKSQYLRGRQCLKSLWLYNYRADLRTLPSPGLQRIFDQGHRIGALARARYPEGRLISAGPQHLSEALAQTAQALAEGATALFEAAFLHDGVLVRTDILLRMGDAWELIEVKGSTEVKDIYLQDLAIQRYVLAGAGLDIRKACIMHVDNEYVRQGRLDLSRLLRKEDLTAATAPLLENLPRTLAGMRQLLDCAQVPDIAIGQQCTSPYACEFIPHCWRDIPEYSVYDLKRAHFEKINELRSRGIMRLEDIPDDFPLSEAQTMQVRVAKTNTPHIDRSGIRDCLAGLRYPLYYLDFETVALAVPPYDGLRPFQPLPFQASLHVQDDPDGPLRHLEYLAEPGPDPRPGMVEFLTRRIGPEGSLVVYNANFEGGRLAELAEYCPEQAPALLSMKARLWDLIIPFRSLLFVHPACRGSASMKAVLPALVPEMSDKGLAINNGEMAAIAYELLMSGPAAPEQKQQTLADLRIYCGQDTLGMVEVLKVLRREISARG
ncbi:MAG: DUF2779 domain-containing protein [Elusimicrobiota bacterium]|jgi:hypothetical protein